MGGGLKLRAHTSVIDHRIIVDIWSRAGIIGIPVTHLKTNLNRAIDVPYQVREGDSVLAGKLRRQGAIERVVDPATEM